MPAFDMVRRGYDREQVDVHVRDLTGQLSATSQARKVADQRIRTLEEELRANRKRGDAAEPSMSADSFGFRAEKILRLAEHEAGDVRARAAREATTLVEQARADAEKHRHEVEQALIARSTALDADAAKRNVAIQEREQQAQVTLADARDESTRISEEAQRIAEKTLADAQAQAEQLRARVDNECRRRREAADQELRRVGELRDGVRTDIVRLHTLLSGEVGTAAPAADGARAADTSAAGASTTTGTPATKPERQHPTFPPRPGDTFTPNRVPGPPRN